MTRHRLTAVVFAFVVAASMVAPAAGAPAPTSADVHGPDAQAIEHDAANALEGDGSADALERTGVSEPAFESFDATDDDSNLTGESVEKFVVRVEKADLMGAMSTDGGVVADLKQHAAASQEPVLEWAAERDAVEVANRFWLANAVVLAVDTSTVDVDALAGLDGVTAVHENFEVSAPDPDPGEKISSASAADANTTYGLDQVNATEVWSEYGTMGDGAKVAVLDTGVNPDHPDIDLYTEAPGDPTYPGGWAEFDVNGVKIPGSEPYDENSVNHGTHTSGTVSGGDASGQYIGVAPNVELMHGGVLTPNGGTFAAVLGGMQWAVANDADVVSMSLGAETYYSFMIEPVRNARDAGTLVVASSGNSGEGTSGTPGNVYESLSVGATHENYSVAGFSSGEVVDVSEDYDGDVPEGWPAEFTVPDVAAPGVDVLSAHDDDAWIELSGTSMAAPHVAGVAALLESASGGQASVTAIEDAIETGAWKPGNWSEPGDEPDTRYGLGIVNASAAADQVALETGVSGTVTDGDGDPVGAATVNVTGVDYYGHVAADGSYRVAADSGSQTLVADAFGYEPVEATVSVPDSGDATRNFTLNEAADARLYEPQTAGVTAGETVSVAIEVASADTLTVTQAGDYAGDASLYVDGQPAEFGEAVAVDDGPVEVEVETGADAGGMLELTHEVAGAGSSTTITTGPTAVAAEPRSVAVVDDGFSGEEVVTSLEQTLPSDFTEVDLLESDEALDAIDEYDAFVVNEIDTENTAEFVAETRTPLVGTIWLGQDDYFADFGIRQRSEVVGNPAETGSDSLGGLTYYEVLEDHPIFDGLAEEGEQLMLIPNRNFFSPVSDRSWFSGWDGEVLANVVNEGEVDGSGVGIDSQERTALLASLGATSDVGADELSHSAKQVLGNAVDWASQPPAVIVSEGQADRVDPGTNVSATAYVEDLVKVKTSLGANTTIPEASLSLSHNGSVNAFDEWRSYPEPVSAEEFPIEVTMEGNHTGVVELDHSLVVETADGTKTFNVTTGPTAVYEPPLSVPADAATVQEAATMAPAGAEIVVSDGEYAEQVTLDATNVTLRAAANATPTLVAPGDADEGAVLRVTADGVTVDGLDVDGGDDLQGVQFLETANATATDLVVEDAATGVHLDDGTDAYVANVTATGIGDYGADGDAVEPQTFHETAGVFVNGATDAVVENVSVTNATQGVSIYGTENVDVTGASVENAENGMLLISTEGSIVIDDATIRDATTGVSTDRVIDTVVQNSTITDVETGVYFDPFFGSTDSFVGNTVENASVGVHLAGNFEGPVRENTFGDGVDTGVVLDEVDTGAVDVRYNDFAAANTSIDNRVDEAFDGRLNYYGERGGHGSTAGDVVYEPYLTAPPSEVVTDASETTRIGVDFGMDAGEVYAFGVPGPVSANVSEVFGDFEGVVYGYDADAGSWEQLTGSDPVEPLQAMVVVAETDARASLSFHAPGDSPRMPAETHLEEGWNFVSPALYADAETAFDYESLTFDSMVNAFAQPADQPGEPGEEFAHYRFGSEDSGPALSPFHGYYMFVEEGGTQPGYLLNDVTMAELYEFLGIDVDELPVETESATAADADDGSQRALADGTATGQVVG